MGLLSPLFINQAYAENHQLDFASNNWSLIKTIKLQKTEQEITESIESLSKHNLTMIIIAHRISSLKYCDRIYMVEDKRVCIQENITPQK